MKLDEKGGQDDLGQGRGDAIDATTASKRTRGIGGWGIDTTKASTVKAADAGAVQAQLPRSPARQP
ncbi:MAG: hypothetical protein Q4E06_10615 [Lautropia sp.]|nr:hypothetical protein [Lautropia sp.]